MWVQAPAHVKRVAGAAYDDVPTTNPQTPPSRSVREVLGPRRPTGWVLLKLEALGPDRGVLHAPDCDDAREGAPVLELEPLLKGFDRGFDPDS
ncbi:hypothetical protein LUX09_34235 [Streptomyces albogriseolus]|nr:hypothetical protein [Streptomyces albogriseolus]